MLIQELGNPPLVILLLEKNNFPVSNEPKIKENKNDSWGIQYGMNGNEELFGYRYSRNPRP